MSGELFGAYYKADSSNNSTVYGTTWNNQILVGSIDGRGYYFIPMYKEFTNGSEDTRGFNETVDFDGENADLLIPRLQTYLTTGTGVHPCAMPLIDADVIEFSEAGLSAEDVFNAILLRRAGIITEQFQGFKHTDIEGNKEVTTIDEETGVETTAWLVKRCSLEGT